MKIQNLTPARWTRKGMVAALIGYGALAMTLAACAPEPEPAPTLDLRTEAIAILKGSITSGSPGSTPEQREDALELAIETLETTCVDPDAPITLEAYELSEGAQQVLVNNGIVPCEAFS